MELDAPGASAMDGMPGRYVFVRIEADRYKEGYNKLMLRNDAAAAYEEVRKEVLSLGGILTSSGGIRSLTATVNPSLDSIIGER